MSRPAARSALAAAASLAIAANAAAADFFVPSKAAAQGPGARTLVRTAQRDLGLACHARATLHTEGTLPHRGDYDASQAAQRDFYELRDMALAWRLTGAPAFRKTAAAWLGAWSAQYRPSYNPIDETNFDGFIMAYAALRPELAPAVDARCRRLLTAWAKGYPLGLGRRLARGAVTSNNNNWESHRVEIAALSAAALDDHGLMDGCEAMFRRQLGQNLLPGGEVIDFRERDALHYVVYDLQPLVEAALAARSQGRDWYGLRNARGVGLPEALAWLEPYAEGRLSHEEFVHSKVPFDARRAAAGVKGFSGPWDPAGAAELYALAARLDGRWAGLAAEPAWRGRVPGWIAFLPPPGHGPSRP